ncbi:MAG TPA: fumarylacetoacetate hydrolase family protein, partial [Acidimicrobiales bacterium]|nr:fumarylacetoacetate hydrolase family protein [Acidimicrobiales bacterium]
MSLLERLVDDGSPFPIQNLPYGVFSHDGDGPRVGVAIGAHVVDLAALEGAGLLGSTEATLSASSLNPFLAAGRLVWAGVRARLTDLLAAETPAVVVEQAVAPLSEVTLHLPFQVADYVDFYSSLHHAQNLGRIFRPEGEPLTPNWRHLPIGYHGRSGTVVVSGTPIVRPHGQRLLDPADAAPTFGPSTRLDIECEVGFVVGVGTTLGRPVAASALADHVFGVVLLNDWSARDIQAWETVPLGPFLGKSFATSVSPWVVPLDALNSARVTPPPQEPVPLPYLRDDEPWALDLSLSVSLNGEVLSRPPFAGMYWTPGQQLAHMTVNGASLRTGD